MTVSRRNFLYGLGTGAALPFVAGPAWGQESERPPALQTTVAVDSLDPIEDQVDIVVEFGLPLRAGHLAASERIVVRDGTTVLQVQEDSRASDRNGDIRFVSLAVLLPFLRAGDTKVLDIAVEPGSPDQGPSRSVADLLAMDDDAQCTVRVDDHGEIYLADFRTAASARTRWIKGTPHRRDAFFHDGPLRKTFTCLMPMTSLTVTAAHSHMYLEFMATAFSNDGFASDISWRFDPVLLNGWADEPNPADQMIDVEITTGRSRPLLRTSLTGRNPDVSLVIAKDGAEIVTSPYTPGTFDVNDHGRVIEAADGSRALIVSVTEDGAGCGCRDTRFLGNSLHDGSHGAGTWRIHGFNLPNRGSLWDKNIWHGRQANFQVRHERDYLFDSRMLLNYAVPSSYIDNMTGRIGDSGGSSGVTYLEAIGDHPIPARLRTHVAFGERAAAGNEPETYPLPDYQYISLRKLENDTGPFIESAALTRIFRTADIWAMRSTPSVMDDNTGALLNTGVPGRESYVDNHYPKPTNEPLARSQDSSHRDNHWFIPYLLTGKFFYLRAIHTDMLEYNLDLLTFNSLGLTRPIWSTWQARAKGWADRSVGEAAVITPDGMDRTITGWSKADILGWQAVSWEKAYSLLIDDGSGRPGWANIDPPGPHYGSADDPLYLPSGAPSDPHKPGRGGVHHWQVSYMGVVGKHLHELGALTDAGTALYRRVVGYLVNLLVSERITIPNQAEELFGLGGSGYSADWSAGHFADWDEIAKQFQNNRTPFWYQMYHHAALVGAEEWGVYDLAKSRKALMLANQILQKGRGVETGPDLLSIHFGERSKPLVLRWWIARRTD